MPTDYLIFIHGVSTRSPLTPTYADYLFGLIQTKCQQLGVNSDLVKVPLYWGDIPQPDEDAVLAQEKASSIYDHFNLRSVREHFILPFVGDAVSYISRLLGGRVVEKLKADAQAGFQGLNAADTNRLHLITHSWGTVILFDVLFADRWDDPSVFGAASVMQMRDVVFGLPPSPLTGLVIRSIHTMGSPLDVFSLMELAPAARYTRTPGPVIPTASLNTASSVVHQNAAPAMANMVAQAQNALLQNPITPKVQQFEAAANNAVPPTTHAISDNLSKMLATLNNILQRPLTWYNFAHPGDLVAYPIEQLMPSLLNAGPEELGVQDFLVTDAGPQFLDDLEPYALLKTGDAHQSYWKSNLVAEHIAQAIKMSQ